MLSCLSLFCLKLLEPQSLLLLVAKFSPSGSFRLKISKSLLSSPREKVDISVYLVKRSPSQSLSVCRRRDIVTLILHYHIVKLWREIAVRLVPKEDTMESNIQLIFRMHKSIIIYQFIL